jgi:DNA recombination protein RmuC
LKELLENVFSQGQYQLQYTIAGAGIVDAALFIGDKTIPIDAKFPQENYERLIHAEDEYSENKYASELKKDIKKRIDETSKYIVPENDTTDFAFMLIPAE